MQNLDLTKEKNQFALPYPPLSSITNEWWLLTCAWSLSSARNWWIVNDCACFKDPCLVTVLCEKLMDTEWLCLLQRPVLGHCPLQEMFISLPFWVPSSKYMAVSTSGQCLLAVMQIICNVNFLQFLCLCFSNVSCEMSYFNIYTLEFHLTQMP